MRLLPYGPYPMHTHHTHLTLRLFQSTLRFGGESSGATKTAARFETSTMEQALQNVLRFVWNYPKFLGPDELPGPHAVSSLVRTRIDHDSPVVSVSYPAEAGGAHGKQSSRVPYWSQDEVEGMVDYLGGYKAIISTLQVAWHPSTVGLAPLVPPDGRKGWPVIVLSHGLAGCADMYTDLCRALASFGYIVMALEHEDGSGVHATRADGTKIRYTRPDSLTPYSRQKVTTFRAGFLQHRVDEVERVLSHLQHPKEGAPTADVSLHQILRLADASHVSLVGHSFGAASSFLAAQHLGSKYPLRLAALLDTWAFSLPDTTLQAAVNCSTATHEASSGKASRQVPVVSLISEEWTRSKELFAVDTLLQALQSAGRLQGSYFVKGTVHQSFSDSALWLPVTTPPSPLLPLPPVSRLRVLHCLCLAGSLHTYKHTNTMGGVPEMLAHTDLRFSAVCCMRSLQCAV